MPQTTACRTAALAAATLIATAAAAGQTTESPFEDLVGTPDLGWSNDRFSISVHWAAETYSITLPGLAPLTSSNSGRERHSGDRAELRIGCRADNGRPGYGIAAPKAVAEVPRHPDLRYPYDLPHPMFWILGLTGNDVRRTPVDVRLDDRGTPVKALIETPMTVYNLLARLPHTLAALPARRLLGRLAAGLPVRLDATGEEAALAMRFPAAPRLAPAARAMLAHCPRSDTANLR